MLAPEQVVWFDRDGSLVRSDFVDSEASAEPRQRSVEYPAWNWLQRSADLSPRRLDSVAR